MLKKFIKVNVKKSIYTRTPFAKRKKLFEK